VTDETKRREALRRVEHAESSGQVADSMELRKQLLARVHAGEMTLEEAQAQLARVKRQAKSNGKVTRAQAYRGGGR